MKVVEFAGTLRAAVIDVSSADCEQAVLPAPASRTLSANMLMDGYI